MEGACSSAQTGIWFAERLGDGRPRYRLASALELEGDLDERALELALRDLLARHPILLSAFPERDGGPVRVAVDPETWALERGDPATPADPTAPFDIEAGPLFRATLTRTGERRHTLHLVAHHLVFDGISRDLVVHDLARRYDARVMGVTPPSSPAPLPPYTDYVEQERARGSDPPPGWPEVATLAGAPPLLSGFLPRPRGSDRAVQVELPREGIAALADGQGTTPFVALLATFGVLLDRYAAGSGGEAPVLAVPMNTRPRAFRQSAGLFVNELPLRPPNARGMTFRGYMEAVARQVRTLLPLRSWPIPSAPATVVFGYRRVDPEPVRMAGLHVAWQRALPGYGSHAELEVQLLDDGERVGGRLEYDPEVLDGEVVARLAEHWGQVVRQVVAAPERPLDGVCLLSPGERHRIVEAWNDTAVDHGTESLVTAMIEEQARQTPGAPAVVFEGEVCSYAELERRAHEIAQRLQALGVGPESFVAVCAERSPELVAGLLGVLKAGAAYVPLDPDYPDKRLAYMLDDCAPAVLLTQERLLPRLRPDGPGVVLLDRLDARGGARDQPRLSAGHPAYAIYTSGSTGAPKAAIIAHGALRNRLLWMQRAYHLEKSDRVLQKTPAGFDVSVWEFFWPLLAGATLVLARPGGHRDPAYLAELIDRERVTTVHFVPSMLRAFLELPDLEACRSLRRVLCSGEELPAVLADRCMKRLDAELHNLYGPTEAAIDVTAWRCAPGEDPVPIGRPIDNLRLHILDPDLQPLPVGIAGELYIGGSGLARGYLHRPGLTAERFVPDPLGPPGERLYRTGDLARYRSDGAIEFLGRLDHQVKIRGNRVEPGEVEAMLLGHPAVDQAVVVGRDAGRGEPELVAYIVAESGADLDGYLRERLPDAMVPAAFVELPSLPLTPNGKLDRAALPDPVPAARDYVPPRTATERVIADVWSELFEIDRVGSGDDFFALGGHSLLAAQTIGRLREALGVDLPLRVVFERPTVAALAAAAEEARA